MKIGKGILPAALACALAAAALVAGCGGKTAPMITLVSPTSGAPGTVMTITGSGFGAAKEKSVVQLSGKAIGVRTWSDSQITATVPSDATAGTYNLTVVTDGGTGEGGQFKVTGGGTSDGDKTQPGESAQKGVIEIYAKTHNLELVGPGGNKKEITLYQASEVDPDWELWQMPAGEGTDIDYFLLENQEGRWTVINGGFWGTTQPQGYGAPSDLKIPAPK